MAFPEDKFVILQVGNRLVQEVTEDFLKTIYTMLEENPKQYWRLFGNSRGHLGKKGIARSINRESFYLRS